MKQLLCIAAGLFAVAATAQDFQGVAVYQSKTKMTITVSDDGPPMDDGLKEQLAKLSERTYTMVFNKTESVYEEEAKLDKSSLMVGGYNLSIAGGKLYKNLKDKAYLEEKDLMGKEFLIQDSLETHQWVLSNETKKIGDYTCYKATYNIPQVQQPVENEGEEKEKGLLDLLPEPKDVVVTAWYTPQIPVSHGPSDYWGLPGLILEINHRGTTLLCSKITLNPKDKTEIKKPKKGQKVTYAEYEAIMKKKFEEMNEMNRPAGNQSGNTKMGTTTIRIGG
ncbi:hypothetical protein AM493_10070 [Flavobacterium akiainvivens]|uniref:GLPGLI family protein n=1 Tax=Flavobacterium akiainvivens TaxID=1202724 RepID=A0A0M9VI82_9FLAO|nr:GLPGLI family protein [Flavobacterium akiainvivens]KOS06339.1 hypothetical protein AM493_10070 [Flavobacterium akiainvivens]SFQ15848.1 GLPGLI family protein [Flavobacterium akiainvivens]